MKDKPARLSDNDVDLKFNSAPLQCTTQASSCYLLFYLYCLCIIVFFTHVRNICASLLITLELTCGWLATCVIGLHVLSRSGYLCPS